MDLSTVQRRIELIEKYENEIKIAKNMIQNNLENDPSYIESSEQAKEVLSKKRAAKEAVLAQAEVQKLLRDIKDNVEEITTLKEILSQELMQFYQESNIDEIEDAQGDVRKFKVLVKLLPKKNNKNNFEQYSQKEAIKDAFGQ